MDNAVMWYRRKIGTYDLQIWEKAVEMQEQKFKGIESRTKQDASLKSDLIDIDLVRGSTFSKNKPQHNVIFIMWMGLVRMLLFPVFFKWWIQQANGFLFVGFLFLYIVQIICLVLYIGGSTADLHDVHISEVALPAVLMLVLGLIHCQVVSTNLTVQTSSERLLQKRTLSKALLEPAKSTDYQQTLSFVNSSVRNMDSGIGINSEKTHHSSHHSHEKHNLPDVLPGHSSQLSHVDSTVADGSINDYKATTNVDDDILLEHLNDESIASDSSGDESSAADVNDGTHLKSSPYLSTTALLPGNNPSADHINVRVWEGGQWKKCQASLLHIGGIIMKKVDSLPTSADDYSILCFVCPIVMSLIPAIYRFMHMQRSEMIGTVSSLFIVQNLLHALLGKRSYCTTTIIMGAFVERLLLTGMFIIMLCAAQQTFKKRFLYAKYFTHLTSSRRAKKSLIPHFRLNKVQNIRVWLALRSYLRRRGPQRSVDVIVSAAFLFSLSLLCFITVNLMNHSETFASSLMLWDSLILLIFLALFILSFIITGAKINKKYNSISTLLTEQINLQLQIEKKPEKKETLQRANGVLTLAAKLIKEIEEPFNIYGLAMNPILYNITRVILLSAFSGVVSEMLGFKLKIWKIKT